MGRMLRPCFLVVDREHSGSISTRKLVIETAKFNVITAYSGAEAVEALMKFPRVDGVVLDVGVRDIPCGELIQRLKEIQPKLTVVAIGKHGCHGADHNVDSFDPKSLLGLLENLHSSETAEILHQDEVLSAQADSSLVR